MSALHYGRPLAVKVEDGRLVIEIGVDTLAFAVTYADWANPWNDALNDHVRTFAITNTAEFAKDVLRAMLDEREDGSTPLSDFLDKMTEAAVDDGSMATEEARITYEQPSPLEPWRSENTERGTA